MDAGRTHPLRGLRAGPGDLEEVSRELWQFYAAMILALLLATYVPAISLWLPSLLRF